MFPKTAFGLFMSKERYQTQQQLLDVVRHFRADGFPLDTIVQDWQYWGGEKDGVWDGKWSGMVWDRERFPDPAAMTRELHGPLHTRLMVSIWPSVGNDTALARDLDVLFGSGRALEEVRRLALDEGAPLEARKAALRTFRRAAPRA